MTPRSTAAEPDQAGVIAFLARSETHGGAPVAVIETHGAFVFAAGGEVYKIKRAVRYAYMDFSTLEARRRACEREIEINRPMAPALYLGVVAITRDADGQLALGGRGVPVEWAVHMRRFDGDDLLTRVVETGRLDAALARRIADVVHASHAAAAVARIGDGTSRIAAIVEEVAAAFQDAGCGLDHGATRALVDGCRAQFARTAPLLDRRARDGFVRRCHGDLHLANMVLWQGRPTLFDALEFDETLATIDTLYDLAFLLMDLDVRGERAPANLVLNRYLWRSQAMADIDGLAALPLFMALRAAIRAMVTAQRTALGSRRSDGSDRLSADAYLAAGLGYVTPAPPLLVAVGGLSGTGKSTLAAALAPGIGAAPGALHLRSDLERKAMLGVGELERLPDAAYDHATSERVYRLLEAKARTALGAGHAVVLDAALLNETERTQAEAVARAASVPFIGLWLTAPLDVLIRRVEARVGDASDAKADVVRRQIRWAEPPAGWMSIDASGTAEATLAQARAALG